MVCVNLRSDVIPISLRGWQLLDSFGLPRFWSTVWADVLRAGLADSTRSRALYAVERLYQHCEEQLRADCLDALLFDQRLDELESVLSGFFTRLRNQAKRDQTTNASVWGHALGFVLDVLRYSSKSDLRLQENLKRLEQLYNELDPAPPRPPAQIRALPAVVIDDLYRIFNPLSADNPFRTEKNRARNYFIFVAGLTSGLRRGELAVLPKDALVTETNFDTSEDVSWINVRENPYEASDPRLESPSIKNHQSVRQIPVSEEMLTASETTIASYMATQRHSYLLSSQKGNPISLRALQRIFEVASSHLSDEALTALKLRGKESITAHDLRHTCAAYRLKRHIDSGCNLDDAMEKLRVFFGWAPNSNMPKHYARAYFETAADDVWSDNYDSFVRVMREIQGY